MAVAYVNGASAVQGSVGTTDTLVTSAQNHVAGNALVVYILRHSGATISSINDTAGNTFTDSTFTSSVFDVRLDAYYVSNILGNASNQITVVLTGSISSWWVVVDQYSGVATSSALRTGGTGSSNGTTATSSSFNTVSGDVISAMSFGNSSSWAPITAGANFTGRQTNIVAGGFSGGTEDRITIADLTGTTATMDGSTSTDWLISAIVLKATEVTDDFRGDPRNSIFRLRGYRGY